MHNLHGMDGLGVSVRVKLPKEVKEAAKQVPELNESFKNFTAQFAAADVPGFRNELGRFNSVLEAVQKAAPVVLMGSAALIVAMIVLRK